MPRQTDTAEPFPGIRVGQFFGIHPFDVDMNMIGNSAVR